MTCLSAVRKNGSTQHNVGCQRQEDFDGLLCNCDHAYQFLGVTSRTSCDTERSR
jgi:hypothetical protein